MKHALFAIGLALAACSGPALRGTAIENASWTAAPGLTTGIQTAPQYGDPSVGPYQVLIKFPAGTVVKPHFHKVDEFATVVSGSVVFGQGDTIDDARGVEVGAGGYVVVPGGVAHWAKCKVDAVIARFGNGPRELTDSSPEKPAPNKGAGVKAVQVKDVPWEPSDLAPGAATCAPWGDPKTGPHMFRVKFPKGIVRPPHWHNADECVTVLAGKVSFGQGEKVEAAPPITLGTGGTYIVPKTIPHWLRTEEDSQFIVFVSGARDVIYVNPVDEPKKK